MKTKLIKVMVFILVPVWQNCIAAEVDTARIAPGTGDITGYILNCDCNPIVNATVFLNAMPDELCRSCQSNLHADGTPEAPYIVWDVCVYSDLNITSTRSDSSGFYAFNEISMGYYQVYCYAPNEVIKRDSSKVFARGWSMLPYDCVRVAIDSISIAFLRMGDRWEDEGYQQTWQGEIKPRKTNAGQDSE